MGRIGTAVARRAQGFDMKVVYYDPYLPEGHELGLGVERVKTKEELLERADVVSIHVPLSKATEKIVGRPELARMRQGAILINIARGRLVDVDAVYEALKSGHLGAAGLDVIPEEPPTSGSRLLEAWQAGEEWIKGRFILTPHAAYYSEAGHHDIRTFATEILLDYLEKGHLRNNVNPDWRKGAADRQAKAMAEELVR
jgi:D-3-phosphoglycerate dehydrogenase